MNKFKADANWRIAANFGGDHFDHFKYRASNGETAISVKTLKSLFHFITYSISTLADRRIDHVCLQCSEQIDGTHVCATLATVCISFTLWFSTLALLLALATHCECVRFTGKCCVRDVEKNTLKIERNVCARATPFCALHARTCNSLSRRRRRRRMPRITREIFNYRVFPSRSLSLSLSVSRPIRTFLSRFSPSSEFGTHPFTFL